MADVCLSESVSWSSLRRIKYIFLNIWQIFFYQNVTVLGSNNKDTVIFLQSSRNLVSGKWRSARNGNCTDVYFLLQKQTTNSSLMEQYNILGRIGEGAHGIVFKAKHLQVTTTQLQFSGVTVPEGQRSTFPWKSEGCILFVRPVCVLFCRQVRQWLWRRWLWGGWRMASPTRHWGR